MLPARGPAHQRGAEQEDCAGQLEHVGVLLQVFHKKWDGGKLSGKPPSRAVFHSEDTIKFTSASMRPLSRFCKGLVQAGGSEGGGDREGSHQEDGREEA